MSLSRSWRWRYAFVFPVASCYNILFYYLLTFSQMINLALSITPKITGTIHVMANPLYAYSTAKVVETGLRESSSLLQPETHVLISNDPRPTLPSPS